MSNTETIDRAAVIAALGLTVEFVFVPYSQSRNAGKWESLNWRATLRARTHFAKLAPEGSTSDDKAATGWRDLLTTDYGAGTGHCPGAKPRPGDTRGGYEKRQRIAFEIENGRSYGRYLPGKPIKPDPLDVIAALVMDSGVLDAGGFENWAAEYGYDTDSRKAEKTYRDCLDIALKLRAGIGEAGLAQLREAFQDY